MPTDSTHNSSRVLIVTRDFLPYCFTLGGVIRILKLAEYLRDNGKEVHILCARGEEIGYFGYEELVRSFRVTYLADRLQTAINRITSTSGETALLKASRSSIGFRFLKKVVNELSIPDVGVFFLGKFIREASRMIRDLGFRHVIVTSPPPSTLLAGYALKKKFGDRVNLLVDYRDSWNLGYVGRKRLPLLDRLNQAMENRVLRGADHFLHVSRPMLDALLPRVPGLAPKATLIMNGYDTRQAVRDAPLPPPSDRLRIGHFGRLRENETHRNPERLFEAVVHFRGRIRLFLYGDVAVPDRWKERLEGVVEFEGVVPHDEAIRRMREMDVLLLYHSEREGAEEVVTGKIFEYMLAQRPILVMGPPAMEAAEIVARERIGYAVDLFDTPAVESALRNLHELWKEGNLVRYDIANLKQYSRQHQYSKILPLLT